MQKIQLINFVLSVLCIGGLLLGSCNELDPEAPGNLVAKTVDEDATIPAVTLSGTKLHCRTYGNPKGIKIFVLEGGPGEDFGSLLPLMTTVNGWSLTQNYQVIYHDYRGCGLSRRHSLEELTMGHSLKDLEELIDYFAPREQVILMGHSHGGKVAVQYTNKHIDRVKGLVLLESGSFSSEIVKHTPDAGNLDYFSKDVNTLLWTKQLIGMGDHETADYFYDMARMSVSRADRGSEVCPVKNFRGGTAAIIAIALDEVENSVYDFTTHLSEFKNNVLFISSEQTKDIGYDFQEQYHVGYFKQHNHVMIQGTGHEGIVTCKVEESLKHIRSYLDTLPK